VGIGKLLGKGEEVGNEKAGGGRAGEVISGREEEATTRVGSHLHV